MFLSETASLTDLGLPQVVWTGWPTDLGGGFGLHCPSTGITQATSFLEIKIDPQCNTDGPDSPALCVFDIILCAQINMDRHVQAVCLQL